MLIECHQHGPAISGAEGDKLCEKMDSNNCDNHVHSCFENSITCLTNRNGAAPMPIFCSPTAIQSVAGVTLPSDQSQLTPCRMMDSYRQACIPLASDVKLREKYINIFEAVRFGRIMEDLDTMAGRLD